MRTHLANPLTGTGIIAIRRPALEQACVSGVVASFAYLLGQAVDRWVVPNDYDDRLLWGGLVSREPGRQRALGFIGHCGVGVVLAIVYDSVRFRSPVGGLRPSSRAGEVGSWKIRLWRSFKRREENPTPGYVARAFNGVAFVQLENLSLFPLVAVFGPLHPSVKHGELPSLWTWRYFWLQVWRHLAYGAVLGVTARKRARKGES